MVNINKTERQTVSSLERQCKKDGRVYYNISGGKMRGVNGKADFFTIDSKGRFVALEAKSSVGKVYPNQLRNGKRVIEQKGRFVVAYPDFDLKKMDAGELPKYRYIDEDMKLPKHSCEVVLRGGEVYHG